MSLVHFAQSSFGLRVYELYAPAFGNLHSLRPASALRLTVDREIKLGR